MKAKGMVAMQTLFPNQDWVNLHDKWGGQKRQKNDLSNRSVWKKKLWKERKTAPPPLSGQSKPMKSRSACRYRFMGLFTFGGLKPSHRLLAALTTIDAIANFCAVGFFRFKKAIYRQSMMVMTSWYRVKFVVRSLVSHSGRQRSWESIAQLSIFFLAGEGEKEMDHRVTSSQTSQFVGGFPGKCKCSFSSTDHRQWMVPFLHFDSLGLIT